ncbi:MAG: hypothetical protein LC792_17665 [Actinobacteria bacterium]|nr:hypothetical protein [Actinomycetota bacterium]
MYQVIARPKARKPHGCESCGRVIAAGETYVRCVTFDGTARTYKECLHCSALALLWELWEYGDDGYWRDMFREYGRDCCELPDVEWFAQYNQRWARPDGTLYDVPTREA